VKNLIRSEEGATMVEYGLMVALIALVSLLAATALGVEVNNIFSDGGLLSALV
jgi:pilus assembly protein Flp/PilA